MSVIGPEAGRSARAGQEPSRRLEENRIEGITHGRPARA